MSGRVISIGSQNDSAKFFQATLNADKTIAFNVNDFADVDGFVSPQTWGNDMVNGIDSDVFSFDANTGILALGKAGRYSLSYSIFAKSTSNIRHEAFARFVIDIGGGFSEIPGSISVAYHRNTAINGGQLTKEIIINTIIDNALIKVQSQTPIAADNIIQQSGTILSAVFIG